MKQTIEEQHNPMREKAVSDYIRQKHNSDECIGFCDGFEKCQEQLQPLVDSHAELLEALKEITKLPATIGHAYRMQDMAKAAIEKAQQLTK